ncbi:MAG: hypothetical protein AAFP80_15300 [Pseudomonadota bacterium]
MFQTREIELTVGGDGLDRKTVCDIESICKRLSWTLVIRSAALKPDVKAVQIYYVEPRAGKQRKIRARLDHPNKDAQIRNARALFAIYDFIAQKMEQT